MERAKTIARTASPTLIAPFAAPRIDAFEMAGSLIVLGCAAALILAGPVLPL